MLKNIKCLIAVNKLGLSYNAHTGVNWARYSIQTSIYWWTILFLTFGIFNDVLIIIKISLTKISSITMHYVFNDYIHNCLSLTSLTYHQRGTCEK